jgi:hypothetical protein
LKSRWPFIVLNRATALATTRELVAVPSDSADSREFSGTIGKLLADARNCQNKLA